ncbi:unnamed protein product [Penicillium nalgiovense]|uniref:Uncharacterized protein n=1 Tax=Penicillium nalgiovense TaxID=60175 RepID=A0A1V6WIQ6_PENNA|nr:hypothetical protein PENNAL_c0260G07113 [Penicillium nalgiovense]CAG8010665.1 unnamed protein product [Penicillium nalgiovense]CAG8026916.1 unnamed protein product [Penicillium nalgiovense]CAG8106518.1 unnamed protein product [Penicillium nalgiovense]CAG8127635.1 unnamed protein product [Penicillium nalgiovense]
MAFSVPADEDTQNDFLRLRDRTPSVAPTPGYFGHESTPTSGFFSPNPSQAPDESSSSLHHAQPDPVGFPHMVEHDDEGSPEEQPQERIQYRIEWKVTLNRRVVAKDTVQDLVQLPSFCWPRIQGEADKILRGSPRPPGQTRRYDRGGLRK